MNWDKIPKWALFWALSLMTILVCTVSYKIYQAEQFTLWKLQVQLQQQTKDLKEVAEELSKPDDMVELSDRLKLVPKKVKTKVDFIKGKLDNMMQQQQQVQHLPYFEEKK